MSTATFTKTAGIVTVVHNGETIAEYPEKFRLYIDGNDNLAYIIDSDVAKRFFGYATLAELTFDGVAPADRTALEDAINVMFFKHPETGGGGGGTSIQFKDEGVNLGAATATDLNFTGAGVAATRSVNQVNVAIGQSRFGKTGEDVTAAENRSFNLGSSYVLTLNSSNPAFAPLNVNNTGSTGVKIITQGGFCIDATSEGNCIVAKTNSNLYAGMSGQATVAGGTGVQGTTSSGIGVIGTASAGGIPIVAQAGGTDVNTVLQGIKLVRTNTVSNGALAGQGVSFDIFNKNSTNAAEKIGSFIWVYTNAVNPSFSTFTLQLKSASSSAMVDIIGANPLGDISLPNIRTYANDAAADADATLPTKAFYKITGNRTVFQKP